MKSIASFLLLVSISPAWATPQSDEQKALYALGFFLGQNVASFNLSAEELKFVTQGLSDAAQNRKPGVDVQSYQSKIGDLGQKRAAVAAEGRKRQEKSFLEKSSKETGAKAFPSGLIFTELKPGSGKSPKAEDTVKVHYRGMLVDGTEFDSSYKRKESAQFPLNGVIPCWTEGVQKMKVGGKARLVCPSDIAYGDQGRPPVIPGGATLIFEVELLEIVKS
ncbi:MAG: FKBP-type peptidyl-prolyl cis-trans isomerase [Elusimicrobia bacterium]|nr:FKBP-type peptidyl-prolyl cis-trans isomerase [Elusimicrobiota bacterium]